MSKLRYIAAGVLALGFLACKDTLVVQDVTDPDRDRALGRPADVETFIGSTYAQVQNATLGGSNDDIQTQLQVMGMENTSALANFAMGPRGAIPRTPIENTRNSTGDVGNFRDFTVLHRAARMAVIAIARASPTAFPLPTTWINGQALDTTGFFRFIRSYKARFRAGVARSPAERAAADWVSIIADANAGITADFSIAMNPAAGWDVVWPIQAFATGPANWHQMSQFWMGMADSSGQYDAWLALPNAQRAPFLVVTADKRFPSGTTRALQIADTLRPNYRTFTGFPYVRTRQPGEDQPGQPLQISMLDFYRSRSFFAAGRIGNYPIMTRAEIRLLAAAGYIRTGNIGAATVRIDSSRVTNGVLPGLVTAGIADTLTAIPG